jgi:hypothetical protein
VVVAMGISGRERCGRAVCRAQWFGPAVSVVIVKHDVAGALTNTQQGVRDKR